MKRLTKGFLSFIMMTSYALGMSAQDATFVPADEIPSSLRDAASLKLTGTWGTSAFAELKMALGTNAIGGSNMVLTRVDMGEAVIEDGTSWYVSAGFTSNGVFSSCKALKEVVMPVAEEAAHLVSMEKAFANCNALETVDLTGCVNVSTFSNAFYACESLKGADLSTNVAAVKSNAWASAFEACTALAQVKLPAGFVTTSKVFSGCVALQEIDWSACTATEVPVFYADMLDGVELSGVTLKLNHPQYVLFKADEGWSQLNLLDLNPEPSTEFTVDASDIPSSLKKATAVTLTGTWDSDAFNLLSMALGNNGGLFVTTNATLVTLDMSRIKVAENTPLWRQGLKEYGIFNNCTALEKVIMPTAEEAGHFTKLNKAFEGCTALRDIDLSLLTGATDIEAAFKGTAIEKADLSCCTSLGSTVSAFEGCVALQEVILPSCFVPANYTFADCTGLKLIDYTAYTDTQDAPAVKNNTFSGIDDLKSVTLKVNGLNHNLFETHKIWSEFDVQYDADGIQSVVAPTETLEVYAIDGRYIGTYKSTEDWSSRVPYAGIYIVNGKKVLKK